MVAVVRKDGVVGIVERPDHAHLTELLADARVRRSREQATAEQIEERFLGEPDQVAIGVEPLGLQGDQGLTVGVPLESLEGYRAFVAIAANGSCSSGDDVDRCLARDSVAPTTLATTAGEVVSPSGSTGMRPET